MPVIGGWGAMLAIAIGLPLLGSRPLWLLDWVAGPHTRQFPPTLLGLNGGLTSGVPFVILSNSLVNTFGAIGTWIPLLFIFPIAAVGMGRLVGGSWVKRLASATLYCVNPFVFERVFVGHFGLLVGYALLPLACSSALHYFQSGKWWRVSPALWWAVLTGFSAHFAWIYGVLLVAAWVTHRPLTALALTRLLALGTTFALLESYVFLPHTASQLQISTGTANDLMLYRTSGDPYLGLFGNVLGLYGFWRVGPVLPKDSFSGWPFVLLAILVVAGVGASQHLRRGTQSETKATDEGIGRRGAAAILLAGIAGYFLALGDQGPTGPLFRWAYFHVPFFAVMEEPQKFLMLTALAYAVFFGWGVERLTGPVGRLRFDRRTVGAASLAVLLPLAYTPTIFDGLAGQIAPSHLPSSWQAADQLMGNGSGQILFLPWHLYMAFPFTDGRVIANPAPTSFRRSVISGDNLEAGVYSTSTSPRSAYLEHLFALGPDDHRFGSHLAPLGVQFVVLAKTADWHNYSWVAVQSDLRLVLDSASLEVWRNRSYVGVGQSTANRVVRQISPVAYAIGPGPPGLVSLDAPYQKGWVLGGQAARRSAQGTLLFQVGRSGGTVRFTPWGLTRLGYVISGTTFVLLSIVVVLARARRRPPRSPTKGR